MPPLPKPEPHWKARDRTRRQREAARQIAADATWSRADHQCEVCGRWVKRPKDTVYPFEMGHIDEILPRSLGGSDTDTKNLRLLCHDCHFSGPSGAHRKTVRT